MADENNEEEKGKIIALFVESPSHNIGYANEEKHENKAECAAFLDFSSDVL